MARLFISQERLDQWTVSNKVQLVGERLTLREDGRSFSIAPAVRFLRAAGGDDKPRLVGTVRRESDLAGMGGELYMNSVIVGDTAYDVECGFLGDPLP